MADLDPIILQAVGNGNFKTVAEMGVLNSLAHQNRLNIMAEASLASVLGDLRTTSVPEGLGIAAAQRGDLGKVIMELSSAVAAIQNMLQAPNTPKPS